MMKQYSSTFVLLIVLSIILSFSYHTIAAPARPRETIPPYTIITPTGDALSASPKSVVYKANSPYHDWLQSPPADGAFMIRDDPQGSCELCKSIMEFALAFFEKGNEAPHIAVRTVCNKKFPAEAEAKQCIELGDWLVDRIAKVFSEDLDWSPEDYCGVAKQCPVDCCGTDHTPEQVIMTLGETYQQRHFSWATRGNASHSFELSTDATFQQLDLVQKFTAKVFTYDMGGWLGHIYRVSILQGLEPGLTYYYRMGNFDVANSTSQTFHFTIAPEHVGTDALPLNMMIFGDMDLTYRSLDTRKYIDKMLAKNPKALDAILLLGDLGYQDGVERKWTDWMGWLEKTFTVHGIPVMHVPGNHENMITKYMVSYTLRFPRNNGDPAWDTVAYGSHSFGTLHIQTLNSESILIPNDLDIDSFQTEWVKNDLMKKASTAKWKISSLHRPLYCSSGDGACTGQADRLKAKVEGAFNYHDVDMVFYGHVHSYERTTQVSPQSASAGYRCTYVEQSVGFVSEVCQQGTAPVYVLAGNGGNDHSSGQVNPPHRKWSSQLWYPPGMGMLTVTDELMRFQYIDSATGTVVDNLIITRQDGGVDAVRRNQN